MINVTVWNEFYHENHDENIRALYPRGIHGCIAEMLAEEPGVFNVTIATLQDLSLIHILIYNAFQFMTDRVRAPQCFLRDATCAAGGAITRSR